MKKLIITSILALLIAGGSAMRAQERPDEYLGLPGDNLNLYAVMKLFQESETLEGFERSLNDPDSRINNLDLNGDNLVDYITVQNYVDGDVHTIVLRTALNRKESQDLAVFTVQKFRNGEVQIQLIGDEALYGKNYIIEPIYAETPNPGYLGRPVSRANTAVVTTTYYEVATWPLVRYIYSPAYIIWRSPWYWGYYPVYWNPWRPYYWDYYYGYHYNWYSHYYSYYRPWHHYRYSRYNDFYCVHVRNYSPTVIVNINRGTYRTTYSRPESRRDGEALYARTVTSQNTRTQTVANQDRRSAATSTGNSVGTSTERRTAASTATRTATGTTAGQRTAATRREATTTTPAANVDFPAPGGPATRIPRWASIRSFNLSPSLYSSRLTAA
ncbi:MAG: hypothetical protein K0B05_13425, partial [Bacteroidales bacterium]|nr:hypothetical protein [Bacteroidales bacterium]